MISEEEGTSLDKDGMIGLICILTVIACCNQCQTSKKRA